MPINEKEIAALVKLLDDPDQSIYGLVEGRLLGYGHDIVRLLESEWERSFDPVIQQKLETVIHKIQFESVKADLTLWNLYRSDDLLEGILIINRYQYPDLKEEKIRHQIEEIKQAAWLQLGYRMTPFEKVKTLNHVFYRLNGFSGNTVNHQDPQNSYLNLVLETKKGNQVSLAILYSLVAQKLDIPIYGVNLPQHFILAYMEGADKKRDPREGDVLFYINGFNKGFVFNRRDIDFFLKQLNLSEETDYYLPCSNIEIVKRVIRNLIGSYEKLGYVEKIAELSALARIFDP